MILYLLIVQKVIENAPITMRARLAVRKNIFYQLTIFSMEGNQIFMGFI